MKNRNINFFAAMIAKLFHKTPPAKNEKDLEFNTSTQKTGLTFTDKIRSTFRHKWIKPK